MSFQACIFKRRYENVQVSRFYRIKADGDLNFKAPQKNK